MMKHCNALTLASIPDTYCLATVLTSNLSKALERFCMMVTQYLCHGHAVHNVNISKREQTSIS